MNIVEAVLALHLGLNHSPYCKNRNNAENSRRPQVMKRWICYCDFDEKMRIGTNELLRRELNAAKVR